jgi:hypothetical protein
VFIKLLKYDLIFGAKWALLLSAAAVLIVVAARLGYFVLPRETANRYHNIAFNLAEMGLLIGGVAHSVAMFWRNMYGKAGYLMLTLPVGRGRLLLSKLVASFIWVNLFVLSFVIVQVISRSRPRAVAQYQLVELLAVYLMFLLYFLVFVNLIYFSCTLTRSIIRKNTVSPWVAGAVGTGAVIGFFLITSRIAGRFVYYTVRETILHDTVFISTHRSYPMGLWPYMRFAVGEEETRFDILLLLFFIAVCIITMLATRWLLNKKVNLQ